MSWFRTNIWDPAYFIALSVFANSSAFIMVVGLVLIAAAVATASPDAAAPIADKASEQFFVLITT